MGVDGAPVGFKKLDAGTEAQRLKWAHGARGVLVAFLDTEGNVHIGDSGLAPGMIRDIANTAVFASYKKQGL